MTRDFPFLFLISVFLLLVSCSGKKDVPVVEDFMPADSLISPEKMVYLLADVQVIEAALLLERNEGRDMKDKTVFFYDGIFAKYHISRGRYDANMKYYSANAAEMVEIYDKVIKEIETRQKKLPVKK